MNPRTEAARQMMAQPEYAAQFEAGRFRVRSQSDPSKSYVVARTGHGLVCECHDHGENGADCKHIKVALEVIRGNRGFKDETFRIMDKSNCKVCPGCSSGNVKKDGRPKNSGGQVQKYKCKDCGKRFVGRMGFERTRHPEEVITGALQMYFTGMSFRDISSHYELLGISVSHVTIHNWVAKYSKIVSDYIDSIVPRTGHRTWVRADEVWVKVAGVIKYLFASMDDDTRFWLAAEMAHSKFKHDTDNIFQSTKKQLGRNPEVLITDKLPGYAKSCRKVFGRKTYHKSDAGIRSQRINRLGRRIGANYHPSNNKMERLNGEIRDREQAYRGLKKFDTPIIKGMRVYYNYTKKHGALGGKTPAEQAGILVEGTNKWKTLIQNARLAASNQSNR